MDKLYRPDKFDTDTDCSTAQREWTHWFRTFENFVEKADIGEDADRLKVLSNFLSSNVFEYINDCTTYETSLATLASLYIKPKNIIYARHLLSTRKQIPSETITQYITALESLVKKCDFKAISAEQNKNDHIRDAFISEYAFICRSDGRETTVSLKHMAPTGDDSIFGHDETEMSQSTPNMLIFTNSNQT
ncbi:uncharacterized protein [Halyomorpha halys]|uniref:uncharacterized protein n=1 Tax=Halyomorpha halys TaxID=286706 RepID=UPI0006D51B7C|nr:uncharacterized protein LOC106692603 [Halyomorpha halys]